MDLPSPDASFDHSQDEEETSSRLIEDSVDPSEESEPEPTLSAASSPARSTSSCTDSLAGATPSEVERVALEFISNAPPSHQQQLAQAGGGLDAFDLPRPPTNTLTKEELSELERKALDYLRKKLHDAEQDDWMYSTPQVFGPPKPLGLSNVPGAGGGGGMGPPRGREFEEGVGWDDKDGNGSEWLDRAFNLERFQVEGLSGTMDELEIAEPPLVEDWQGGGGFGDSVDEGGYSLTG